jgi:hypothetical protein
MRLDRDNVDREKVKARCKRAPKIISGYRAGFDAWQRFQKYRSLADSAYTKYANAGNGTETERRHRVRYEGYSDIADEWESVLNDWLRDMAQIEKDDQGRA